jgi:hypothetical protein
MAPDPRSLEPLEPFEPAGAPIPQRRQSRLRHYRWDIIAVSLVIGLIIGGLGGFAFSRRRVEVRPNSGIAGFARRCARQAGLVLITASGLQPGQELRLAVTAHKGNELFLNPSDNSANVALDGIGENSWRSDDAGTLTVAAHTSLDLSGIERLGYLIYSVDNIKVPLRAGQLDVVDCR